MRSKWSDLVVDKFREMWKTEGKTEMKNRLECLKLLKKPVRYENALYQVGITLSNPNP